jgi:hypothetical protein
MWEFLQFSVGVVTFFGCIWCQQNGIVENGNGGGFVVVSILAVFVFTVLTNCLVWAIRAGHRFWHRKSPQDLPFWLVTPKPNRLLSGH